MKQLKKPLDFKLQISQLKSQGAVIEQYKEFVDLSLIGFPENYANLLEDGCK